MTFQSDIAFLFVAGKTKLHLQFKKPGFFFLGEGIQDKTEKGERFGRSMTEQSNIFRRNTSNVYTRRTEKYYLVVRRYYIKTKKKLTVRCPMTLLGLDVEICRWRYEQRRRRHLTAVGQTRPPHHDLLIYFQSLRVDMSPLGPPGQSTRSRRRLPRPLRHGEYRQNL